MKSSQRYSLVRGLCQDVGLASLTLRCATVWLRLLRPAPERVVGPAVQVGGLGDVVTSLARAVEEAGHTVEVILPKYNNLDYSQVRADPWRVSTPVCQNDAGWKFDDHSAQRPNLYQSSAPLTFLPGFAFLREPSALP